jgi:hypothetical protein
MQYLDFEGNVPKGDRCSEWAKQAAAGREHIVMLEPFDKGLPDEMLKLAAHAGPEGSSNSFSTSSGCEDG